MAAKKTTKKATKKSVKKATKRAVKAPAAKTARPAKLNLEDLKRAQQEADAIAQALEDERKKLEDAYRSKKQEADERVREIQTAKAKEAHAHMVELAREFAPYLGLGHRNQIIKILEDRGRSSTKRAKKAGKPAKAGATPYQYEVDGKPWTGRGRRPVEFAQWEATKGTKWRKDNPGQKYPPFKG